MDGRLWSSAVRARQYYLRSAGGHQFSPVVFDDIHFERCAYDKWGAYGQARTANVLFSVELNRRLADVGVHANAVHPGGILTTELGRHLQQSDVEELMSRQPAGGIKWKIVEAGATSASPSNSADRLRRLSM